MKKMLLFLSILSQSTLCMHDSDDQHHKKDETSNKEIVSPSHILPNAEVNLLVDALKPGEVLFSIGTESGLKVSHEFKDFFLVCYQSGRYQDAFYFVPDNMKEEAAKALNLYGKTNPKFYAYLIPVKDNAKFWELASKTSAGCAQKSGHWKNDNKNYTHRWRELCAQGYTMLNETRTMVAQQAPKQDDDWSCGPNSGYRSLILLGEKRYTHESFIASCPQRISKEATVENGVATIAVGAGLTMMGGFLAPFTFGLSLIPGIATLATGNTLAITGSAISSDVGPTPRMLASFLTSVMEQHKAVFSGYREQGEYEKSIAADIKRGYPRIVLIVSGTFKMHYVNIIGAKIDSNGYLNEVAILDTNGEIIIMTDTGLGYWLDSEGYAGLLLDARYNTVEFF